MSDKKSLSPAKKRTTKADVVRELIPQLVTPTTDFQTSLEKKGDVWEVRKVTEATREEREKWLVEVTNFFANHKINIKAVLVGKKSQGYPLKSYVFVAFTLK